MQIVYTRSYYRWYIHEAHEVKVDLGFTFLDGYCSTVQDLLDWFEVDLGFTEHLFIQIDSSIHTKPVDTTVCCSMLQYVAVCCSVLQYVAVCCSVLQCVAVCCSVLQYVAV